MTPAMRPAAGVVLLAALAGCGTIGAPTPPDLIGVNARLERDRQAAAKRAAEGPASVAPVEAQEPAPAIQLRDMAGPDESISSKPTGDAMIRSR
jgi:hypothetical protein